MYSSRKTAVYTQEASSEYNVSSEPERMVKDESTSAERLNIEALICVI